MTQRLAADPGLDVPEPVVRAGDADDEYRLRRDRLRRVRAARLAGTLIDEVSAEFAADEAADAVWLGASLADLGTTSGSTRQAARKRWPDLGPIYRTRRWLGGHRDDVVAVIGMVLACAGEMRGVGLDHLQPLRDALDAEEPHPGRWRRLAVAVDRHLRHVADTAVPTTDEAAAAVDGARGVVAHFDAITAGPAR
ncbi:MAG: hypothetical protein JWP76_5327 [Dactylosporangium sp.]|nr:hypothetical protein [Dactylosporangium sp.]